MYEKPFMLLYISTNGFSYVPTAVFRVMDGINILSSEK